MTAISQDKTDYYLKWHKSTVDLFLMLNINVSQAARETGINRSSLQGLLTAFSADEGELFVVVNARTGKPRAAKVRDLLVLSNYIRRLGRVNNVAASCTFKEEGEFPLELMLSHEHHKRIACLEKQVDREDNAPILLAGNELKLLVAEIACMFLHLRARTAMNFLVHAQNIFDREMTPSVRFAARESLTSALNLIDLVQELGREAVPCAKLTIINERYEKDITSEEMLQRRLERGILGYGHEIRAHIGELLGDNKLVTSAMLGLLRAAQEQELPREWLWGNVLHRVERWLEEGERQDALNWADAALNTARKLQQTNGVFEALKTNVDLGKYMLLKKYWGAKDATFTRRVFS